MSHSLAVSTPTVRSDASSAKPAKGRRPAERRVAFSRKRAVAACEVCRLRKVTHPFFRGTVYRLIGCCYRANATTRNPLVGHARLTALLASIVNRTTLRWFCLDDVNVALLLMLSDSMQRVLPLLLVLTMRYAFSNHARRV